MQVITEQVATLILRRQKFGCAGVSEGAYRKEDFRA